MIARNEEATIANALDSLHYDRQDPPEGMMPNAAGQYPIWDELIVTLAGESTDNTELIAKAYGAVTAVYPAPDGRWPLDADGKTELRHYGDAREATEMLATGEYVLWIDADERLVQGHELIRALTDQGRVPGVRPHIRPLGTNVTQARQELFHRRGRYRWRGAIHEWLEGMPCLVEPRIVYEEIERPEGDRPHGNMYDLLRREMGDKMETRQLFYIAREHLMDSHWAQAIACCRLFLDARGGWPERRSQVACFAAQAWTALGDLYQARLAYLDALKEWGNWAEPYYGLALVHRDLGMFREALAWGSAACIFEPGEEVANVEIYNWRRFDVMAFCLAQIGRYEEAAKYYEKVCKAHPNHTTEANLRRCKERIA